MKEIKQRNGFFIMVDGIAGSGKSTVLRAVQTWAMEQNHSIFKLSDWTDVEPPRFEDLPEADIYFTYEPTRSWIGRAIRYELSRTDHPYSGRSLAHAFALDREIMYRRLIIPALEAGKTIIQDRGVCTSLVYQPLMDPSLSLEEVQHLPGNELALAYPPNHLILTKISAHEACARIDCRDDDSKGVFAQLSFLQQLEKRFQEPWIKACFEPLGTQIHELDTSGELSSSITRTQTLINDLLTTR